MSRYSRITGTGSYLPPRRVTNADLAAQLAATGVETSDDWIVERTGIRARHFAEPDVSCSDLGVEAARRALEAAGRQSADIDLIIVATSTPDMVFPSAACILQNEVFSRILDFKDRTTCVLFGDGAGAVVLEASDTPGILASDLHADGKHVGILCVPGTVSGGKIVGDPLLKMDGQAVFKLAVGVLEDAARATLKKAGKTEADIRIMRGTAKKLKVPLAKLVVTVDQHGNTSAASIPLALDAAVRSGQVRKGDTLMLEGVGGGFTWGAVLLDF
jgi:3-oxoacyl-[acyl-carrier-protein] synthase-3